MQALLATLSVVFFYLTIFFTFTVFAEPLSEQTSFSSETMDTASELTSDLFLWGVQQAQKGRLDLALGAWRETLKKNVFFGEARRAIVWAEEEIGISRKDQNILLHPNFLLWTPIFPLYLIVLLFSMYLFVQYLTRLAKAQPLDINILYLISLGVLMLVLLLIQWQRESQWVTLVGNHLPLYSAPIIQDVEVFSGRPGSMVKVVRSVDDFLQVRYPGEGLAWVQRENVFSVSRHASGAK